jgi:thiamine biosynthesis lipoprotein
VTAVSNPFAAGTMAGFADRAMGSPLRMTVRGGARAARGAWDAVRREFEDAEEAMSRFRDASELTRLNRTTGTGARVVVSGRLRIALAAAHRARRVTGGRFDPRVLRDLDRLGYRGAPVPSTGAEGRPGTSAARSSERSIGRTGRCEFGLDEPVDLGGIGKGLALRWAAAHLERLAVTDYLLEAGGDLVARGRPAGAPRWVVGIEAPDGAREPVGALALDPAGEAVATSSIRINQWTYGDRTVHHLLDPVTGEPAPPGLVAVTLAARDPAWAEVWTKALFLAGPAAIAEEARARGFAAWWIDDRGELSMTAAARQRTVSVAGEAEAASS